MKNTKTTKRALLSSVMAMLICVSMLIGTTFAWFTDSASTAVNKIQAGKLDVALEMATSWSGDTPIDWGTAEGQTLRWMTADGRGDDLILWEPGCTYNLNQFRIVNKGNLALKYKIVINGIVGDAKLLEAIDFTVTGVDGATTANALNGFEGKLAASSMTDAITISGHMKESAGNEYQGLSIDGIGITVVATQLASEFDSYSNEYDANAVYPPLATYLNETTAVAKPAEGDTVIETPVAKSTVPATAQIVSASGIDDSTVTISNCVMATGSSLERVLKTTESTADSVTYNISYVYTDTTGGSSASYNVSEFSDVVTNVIKLSTGLKEVKVTHTHGDSAPVLMTMLTAMPQTIADNTAYYDSTYGKLYIWSSKYSSFKIEYESDYEAATGGQGYVTLAKALDAVESGGTVILLKNITLNNTRLTPKSNTVIDFYNHTIIGKNIENGLNLFAINGAVTLKNGTVKLSNALGNAVSAIFLEDGADLTMENVIVDLGSSYMQYGLHSNASNPNQTIKAVANNCQFIRTNDGADTGSSTIYMPIGNLTLNNCVVRGNLCFRGTNLTIDGGSYYTGGFINQAKRWDYADTKSFLNGSGYNLNCAHMGESITIIDGRNSYLLESVNIRNAKFYCTKLLTDGTPIAYAVKYYDIEDYDTSATVTVENCTYQYDDYGYVNWSKSAQ